MSKVVVAIGAGIAAIGWIAGFLGFERPGAVVVFAIGFIVAVAGMIGGLMSMPAKLANGRSTAGIKISAIGFAIAALPTTAGVFLLDMPESNLRWTFAVGLGVVILGWVVLMLSLARRNDSDS